MRLKTKKKSRLNDVRVSKLVILRGPSGAGKSTVAKDLFKDMKQPAALIQQDYYRFIFKPAGGQVNSKTVHKMIKQNVLTALEEGYDVLLEGIFNVRAYEQTFKEIFSIHKTSNFMFTFDVSFEETLKRHRTKPNKDEWSESDMRDWYHPKDFLGYDFEHVIPGSSSKDQTIKLIKRAAKI